MTKQLRIIAGSLRGKKINTVPGILTRPTGDRVREAIFNILGSDIEDSNVLDLYSGTGALGIEALSRGAKYVVFVDNHPLPISIIKKNVADCRMNGHAQILRRDLRLEGGWPIPLGMKINIVLMDPPYNQGFIKSTLAQLQKSDLLEKGTIVVAEHTPLEVFEEEASPFVLKDRRKYGKTLVSFYVFAI